MTVKPLSKADLTDLIARKANLTTDQVIAAFHALTDVAKQQLGNSGPEVFIIPGLVKFTRVVKSATKERPGRNPATGRHW